MTPDQLTLDAPTIPVWAAQDSIGLQWWEFHRRHGEVGTALVQLAREWRARSSERCGLKMLWERLRWEHAVGNLPGSSDVKLNNIYTALYARWLMETFPDLDGMFVTRERRSAGPPPLTRPLTPSEQGNGAQGANGAVSPVVLSGNGHAVEPMIVPSVWVVLGFEGTVQHLVKDSTAYDGREVQAFCGRWGLPHQGTTAQDRCSACAFRLRSLLGEA